MQMVLAATAMLFGCATPAQGQQGALPFAAGETCVYRGSNVLGRIGTGTMAVEPADAGTVLLRFDFRGRVGPAGIEDRSRSWFDTAARGSRRFTKRERSPVATRDEDVRMDPAARRWSAAAGGGGAMSTDAPLDELSFLYYVRTLRLAPGETYSLARHYDASRPPVRVRVVGRETTQVPAGRFQTVHVEMRVHDPLRYRGEGIIHLHFTDDARRLLVRMESSIPRAGRMVLSLESGSGGCGTARTQQAD
ncbi:MAG TPA: DUF3108 domain-containing protein [Longimicrobium sp.]|nr:DUF3108 domain-containing protein [Longimicrobium sp.]